MSWRAEAWRYLLRRVYGELPNQLRVSVTARPRINAQPGRSTARVRICNVHLEPDRPVTKLHHCERRPGKIN